MKKCFLVLISLIALVNLWFGCKKEDGNNEPGIDYIIRIRFGNDEIINPAANPMLTVYKNHFDSVYVDSKLMRKYKVVKDTVYILDASGIFFPSNSKYYSSSGFEEDYIQLITSKDFAVGGKYKIYLKYHVEVVNEKTGDFELYYRNGKPERVTITYPFAIREYDLFDPDFKAIAHPSSITIPNHLVATYFTFNHIIEKLYFKELSWDVNYNYRIIIDSAGLYGPSNYIINTSWVINSSKDTLFVNNSNNLNVSTTYKLKLKYHIEVQNKDESGFSILKYNGSNYFGRLASSFNTSAANATIDISNIDYAYPSPNQYHFLKNETSRGVLKLVYNSKSAVFPKSSVYKVRFYSGENVLGESIASYDPVKMKFVFQIPTNSFENQKIYRVEFLMIDGTSKNELVLLTYHFRTSKYNTFAEKLSSVSNITNYQKVVSDGIIEIGNYLKISEPFDIAEGKEFNGLVRFKAVSNSSAFFTLFNWFYDGLKTSRCRINWYGRNCNVNTPSLNAISLLQSTLSPLLTQEQIINNNAQESTLTDFKIMYMLNYYFSQDFLSVRNQPNGFTNLSAWENELLTKPYKSLTPNNAYEFNLQYVAGDIITYTSPNWSAYYY